MTSFAGPMPSGALPRAACQVLDPCTLGRPTHLLGRFAAQLKSELAALFHTDFNRRYRAAFEVDEVRLERRSLPEQPPRWQVLASPVGQIGIGMDRSLLLCLLAYRYGQSAAPSSNDAEPVRETSTEERLAVTLGLRLVRLLAAAVDAAGPAGLSPVAEDPVFAPAVKAVPAAWTIRVGVREAAHAAEGSLWFSLDEAWMNRLLRHLSPQRAASKDSPASEPFPSRLQLGLVARLLEKRLPLGDIMGLQIGDVIPISLGPADVLVDDSRLFAAAVAEERGRLCLTRFEPTD